MSVHVIPASLLVLVLEVTVWFPSLNALLVILPALMFKKHPLMAANSMLNYWTMQTSNLRIDGKTYTPSWSAQSVTCVNRAITNAYTSITKLNLVSKCLNSWFDCPMKRDASVTCSSTPQPTPSPTPSPTPTPTPSPTPTPKTSPKRSFSTVSPTDYTGYWVGTWKVSPQCDQTTCCCLDGNVEVTKLATNSVKLESAVKGACGSTTQFSFTINSISSSNYISTAVAGNTFTMSRTGLELTVTNQQSSACNGKATCVSGDCLSNAVSEGTAMTISIFSVVASFLVAFCFF